MAIHVVQSQQLSVLLQALHGLGLASRKDAAQLLIAQHCIVPNVGVEQWFKQALSDLNGISAHWYCHQGIRSFQWYAYQQVLSEKDRVRKANMPQLMMQWRIYQFFDSFWHNQQLQLSHEHVLYPVLQRIMDSAQALPPARRGQKIFRMQYWLAEQTAKVFQDYMQYRGQCLGQCDAQHNSQVNPPPQAAQFLSVSKCHCQSNWLAQWGRGETLPLEQLLPSATQQQLEQVLPDVAALEAWQALIWRKLFHADWLEIQRIDQQFWQSLNGIDADLARQRLPQQLSVFTLTTLAPSQLQFLRQLAQYIDITVLYFNPSQEYWADTVDPNWKKQYDLSVQKRYLDQHPNATDQDLAQFLQDFTLLFNAERRESRHPLLTRFGKQARDNFSLLANLAAGDEGQWVDAFVDAFPNTLLGTLQRDMLYLNDVMPQQYPLAAEDQSLHIHVCHSLQRQLEVLKDQLLAWLSAPLAAGIAPRQPCDIVVLCPNLAEAEGVIRSVFSAHGNSKNIPIQIAGVSPLDQAQAWQAVCLRMQLLQGRFLPQQLADWLSLPATMQRYSLDAAAITRMLDLLSQAGFRRGFDRIHLQQSLAANDQDYRFSMQYALDRLALAVLMPVHEVFANQLSFDALNRSDIDLVYVLIAIFADLKLRRDWLSPLASNAPVAAQIERIQAEIVDFQQYGVEGLDDALQHSQKLLRMYGLATVNPMSELVALKDLNLPLHAILEAVTRQLQVQQQQATATGAVTFAEIGQLRPLPFQLVVMLQLDSGVFPSRRRERAFDLMQRLRPRLGDRSRLDDEQGAFLDALLMAQQQLWLFYNGFVISDKEVRDPSVVVQDLLDHLHLMLKPPAADLPEWQSVQGLKIPSSLLPLYSIHPLQPFDANGFAGTAPRFQDTWWQVAQQLNHSAAADLQQNHQQPQQSHQHSLHHNIEKYTEQTANNHDPLSLNAARFTAISATPVDLEHLDATQWISDMLFPARLYARRLGVALLGAHDELADQEPIVLDHLSRYQLRDNVLKRPERLQQSVLLQDQLPLEKIQQPELQQLQQDYALLLQRSQVYAQEPSTLTQRSWTVHSELVMQVQVPVNGNCNWVSVQFNKSRPKYWLRLWLEYLLWMASMPETSDQPAQNSSELCRIAVLYDQTLIFHGVSTAQARAYLTAWFQAWRYAQQQILVLPAEILGSFSTALDQPPEWSEQTPPQPTEKTLKTILDKWQNHFTQFDVRDQADNRNHRHWRYLLQGQNDRQLLQHAVNEFAHALYAPIFMHVRIEN